MTVDREQIRRDAEEEISGHSRHGVFASAQRLARWCIALLAELEQAEPIIERYETALRQISALAELGQPADFLARHARAALNPQAHKTEGA